MNHAKWIAHFERNREDRPEPDWSSPVTIEPEVLAALLPSLEQFRLGDGGGPASLIAFNAESFRRHTEEMREIVDFWFAEEAEHARLLGCAVNRFGGRHITSHWSFTAFCLCRRAFGVRFELQVLLLTELVSTAYYRVLRRQSPDAPLTAMCDLILRDEAGHVAFHRDRLAAAVRTPLGLGGAAWQAQFWVCGHLAAGVLWASHGRCLTAIGNSRSGYFTEVRRELRRFLLSLEMAVGCSTRRCEGKEREGDLSAPIHTRASRRSVGRSDPVVVDEHQMKSAKTVWFKRYGWIHLPISWQGAAIAVIALAFCANVFWAIDRRSHSISDTLYSVYPYFVCTFFLLDWIARRTSHESI